MLKAAFVRAFELARYYNRLKIEQADEGSYFSASALRGVAEDIIVLKFLRQLSRKDRDEVILIEMVLSVRKAAEAQAKFFAKARPFQPVLSFRPDATLTQSQKDRLTAIGSASGLWATKYKLPPVEQMASCVSLKAMYDYFYRITSDIVHFNPRIALRSGWGADPRKGTFSSKHYCRYYLNFTQFYSAYLFALFCRTFRKELSLGLEFIAQVDRLRNTLNEELRWPEAVTFEEMNQRGPTNILRLFLRIFHEQKTKKQERFRILSALALRGDYAVPSQRRSHTV